MEFDTCEDCSCGLDEPDGEVQTTEFPLQLQFGEVIRSQILGQTDLDEDSAFIKQVTVCPEKVEVAYTER